MKYISVFMKNVENVCQLTMAFILLSIGFEGGMSVLFSTLALFGVIWVWLSHVTMDRDSETWD